MLDRCGIELVQLNDARPTAHQGRHRQPSLCLVFRLNDGPSAVDASFASPVKIPEVTLRVDLPFAKVPLQCPYFVSQSCHLTRLRFG